MRKKINLLLCFIAFFIAFSPSLAKAEEIHSSINNVTVLPAKFDLSSTRGRTIGQSLKIINDSDDEYIYALSVDNISVTGENGEVGFGDGTSKLRNLFASWIETSEASGKLAAKSVKIIDFKVKVPEITEPGGKYASIVISLDKTIRNPGESAAIAKVVSLVMLTVSGDYEDISNLTTFRATSRKDGGIDFVNYIRNQGIAHVKPKGSIIITNILGQKIQELPLEGDNILPGSTRKTTTVWHPDKRLFGVYHATLVANYGKKNDQVLTGVTRFYRFPLWPTAALTILLAAILSYLIFRKRGPSSHL